MNQIGHAVVQNTKRRFLVGCLTILIGIPVMACCLLGMIKVILPQLNELSSSGQTNLMPIILLIIGIFLIAGMVIVPVVILVVITKKRARMLDSIFVPLGLQGSMYMLVGRHYWGNIADKTLDVYIYRGPTMEIRISSQSKTRIQIMPGTSLPVKISGFLNKSPMQNTNPQLSNYAIYAEDETWAQRLVSDPVIINALHSLMFEHADWALFRHVEIQPGEVLLYLHRSKQMFVKRDQFTAVQAWIDNLLEINSIIDGLPIPAIQSVPINGTSRQQRQKKSKYLLYAVIAILIGLPICLISIGILSYLLIS